MFSIKGIIVMFRVCINGLMHEWRNNIAKAQELRISCINPLIFPNIHLILVAIFLWYLSVMIPDFSQMKTQILSKSSIIPIENRSRCPTLTSVTQMRVAASRATTSIWMSCMSLLPVSLDPIVWSFIILLFLLLLLLKTMMLWQLLSHCCVS